MEGTRLDYSPIQRFLDGMFDVFDNFDGGNDSIVGGIDAQQETGVEENPVVAGW